jgi:hypothetical protein
MELLVRVLFDIYRLYSLRLPPRLRLVIREGQPLNVVWPV